MLRYGKRLRYNLNMHNGKKRSDFLTSEGSKSSTHYLSDTNRFDISSKGPSSGISVGVGESTRVFIQVNILKQHVTK